MTVTVWSERRRTSGWTQCSECSYLMCLVHGGLSRFPGGAYAAAERDAFTAVEVNREASRAAGRPMFPLLDAASLIRYGVRLRTVSGSRSRATEAQLRTALSTPGNMVALPGSYAALRNGHHLRRWQAGFTGGHMVAVLVRSDRSLLWLDPLATSRFAGDVTDLATAMAFAFANNDAHVARAGEFEEDRVNEFLKGMTFVPNRRVRVIAGGTGRWSPSFDPNDYHGNRAFTTPQESSAPILGWVTGTRVILRDGTVFDGRTDWAVLINTTHGVTFWHIHDVIGGDKPDRGMQPIEAGP